MVENPDEWSGWLPTVLNALSQYRAELRSITQMQRKAISAAQEITDYQRERLRSKIADAEREASVHALVATFRFLDSIEAVGFERELRSPIASIMTAFDEIAGGGTPALFAPALISHRPKVGIRTEMAKAQAAFALDQLVKAGKRRAMAAAEVHARVKAWPELVDFTVRRQPFGPNTIISWRKRFSEGGTSDGPATENFHDWRKQAEFLNADPAGVAEMFLSRELWSPRSGDVQQK